MESINQNNYFENLVAKYKPQQDELLKALGGINQFQKNLNFKEFYDITIRSINANSRTIKYFKKHNLNYYDQDLKNCDRTLMVAIESYLYDIYREGVLEFNHYCTNINDESDKVASTIKFKLYQKFNYPKMSNEEIRKNYIQYQYRLERFYEIGNVLSDFDVEKDIYNAIFYYLPALRSKLFNSTYFDDVVKDFDFKAHLFHLQVANIILSLTKLHLVDQIDNISVIESSLLKEELDILINKEEEKMKKLK